MGVRERLQKTIDECEQLITDITSWNENNLDDLSTKPNEGPICCKTERKMLKMAKNAAIYWDAGYIDEAKARIASLSEYCESVEH